MKIRRSERLIDMTNYLLSHPHELISLSLFAKRYESAKSSISEDLGIVKKTFKERGIGLLETLPGAAGGVVGWFLKYLWGTISGELMQAEDMGAYFGELAVDFGSIGWHFLGLLLTFAIMLMGVSKGIEKMNKVMMPIFFIFFILLLIRVVMLPGAAEGYRYMFVPRWEELGNIQTWVYALGQAFFSLSLAGSGTIVYGSYLKKDIDVVSCAGNVALFGINACIKKVRDVSVP